MPQAGFCVQQKPCDSVIGLTQADIQALPMTGACRANQLLAGSGIQRVDPADYRVASAQAQGFAGELQRAFIAVWLQQQNTFAVEAGIP